MAMRVEDLVEILKKILEGIDGLSGDALVLAGALAVAGTLAMAILQVIKELTPVRRWYHSYRLEHWIRERAKNFTAAAKQTDSELILEHLPNNHENIQGILVELATGGEKNAFYDLEIEKLVAQMNAAAQIALEYPVTYLPLLAVLSQGADIDDVKKIVEQDGANQPGQDTLNARNRVGHRIQRNLDGIQIAFGSRWRFLLQFMSIMFTIFFIELAIVTNVADHNGKTLLVGVMLGLVGGYIAPVTRDLVAALQKLRKG